MQNSVFNLCAVVCDCVYVTAHYFIVQFFLQSVTDASQLRLQQQSW